MLDSNDDLMRYYIVSNVAKGDENVQRIVNGMSHDELVTSVTGATGLTYNEWCAEYVLPEPVVKATVNLDPQIAMRVMLRDLFGQSYRLTPYETLLHVKVTDAMVVVSLRRDRVRAGRIREVVTGSDLIMREYKHDGRMIQSRPTDFFVINDADFEPFHRAGQYAKVVSIEDYLESVDQYLMCYRPGWSVRQPLDGCNGRPADADNDLWNEVWELQDSLDAR